MNAVMRGRRFMAGAVIVTMLGIVSILFAGSAGAVSSKHIGNTGFEQRCNNSIYLLCLYWDHTMNQGAYWGTQTNVTDLIGKKFFSGTGTGAGQYVKNNATAMHCDYYVPNKCYSFYNSGYKGNYDWEYWLEIGVLWYTFNQDASVKIT